MFDVTAFAALIKRKRGEARLTQEILALNIFGDSARKADISRLENAKVKNPQEATVQKLCTALNISPAEMEPIRQSRISAAQLDQIPTLSREELENIALRFHIKEVFDRSDADLRQLLTKKATEYRALKAEVDAIPDTYRKLSNLKAAAQDAIDRVDLDEVENLMSMVHETELEEAAKSAEIRANNALLRGNVEQALTLLRTTADSFTSVDSLEPARRKILRYFHILRNHGLRYGGAGLPAAEALLHDILTDALGQQDAWLWASGRNNLAIALQEQGIRTDGAKGADLLAQAVTAYRAALEVRTRADHPVRWAMTQNNLGTALQDQGIRTDGAKGADLLAQAVTACRAALEVTTRADHPVNWAMTQNNLGGALQHQGTRTDGAKGADLLAEAVSAYRAALEVYTRDDHPVDWAMTQNNLAIALRNQGSRTDGAKGADLLAEAVSAYRAALEVYTRADHPVDWAMTQNNLGGALQNQGARTDGAKGADLLAQAVTAYRAALEVCTRADHPVDWAMTQNNLGAALRNQGTRTDGAKGADLLAQAVTAFRAALEVRTRADHPVQWAETQENIAIAQCAIAQHDSCSDPAAALTAAFTAVDAALTVYDPDHMSYDYGTATRLRDGILARINALS